MSSYARSPADCRSPLHLCACSQSTVQSLTNASRRVLVGALLKHEALPVSELSSLLENPASASATPAFETRRDARALLFHVHLPKLEDAGLISGDWADGTVSLGPHPDIREGLLTSSFLEAVEQEEWDAVATASRTRRRHEVLAQLARSGPTLTLDEVAEGLASSTRPAEGSRCSDDGRREQVAVRLHHQTLPKLDEVGLVRYDHSRHEVEYVGGRWFSLSALVDALELGRHAAASTDSEDVSQH